MHEAAKIETPGEAEREERLVVAAIFVLLAINGTDGEPPQLLIFLESTFGIAQQTAASLFAIFMSLAVLHSMWRDYEVKVSRLLAKGRMGTSRLADFLMGETGKEALECLHAAYADRIASAKDSPADVRQLIWERRRSVCIEAVFIAIDRMKCALRLKPVTGDLDD